ncbi:MAG: Uma2 family endonuclease [Chloroflexi bacterium]|nr:Uma2 family endonuclease [Chloroflexota bacterium]
MAVQLQRRTFTVTDYHRMLEAGILTEDDRVELLCGEIIAMAPIGSKHWAIVFRLHRLLQAALASRAHVVAQSSVRLSEDSEPEPDIGVFYPKADDYYSGLPTPADTHLLVEVADTTILYDREVKVPLYGKAGVPETWLVDLQARRVEVYTEPSPNGYRHVQFAYPSDAIAPATFPDVTVSVADIL